jgi:hypothetical protein
VLILLPNGGNGSLEGLIKYYIIRDQNLPGAWTQNQISYLIRRKPYKDAPGTSLGLFTSAGHLSYPPFHNNWRSKDPKSRDTRQRTMKKLVRCSGDLTGWSIAVNREYIKNVRHVM